jgi:hypothetical protein
LANSMLSLDTRDPLPCWVALGRLGLGVMLITRETKVTKNKIRLSLFLNSYLFYVVGL